MAEDPQDWTELKASLADWIGRSDLDARIPDFIATAERRFNRLLRVPEMEDAVAATVSAATVTLPADFLEMRSLFVDADPKVVLEPMTPSELRLAYPAGAAGCPRNYAIQSGAELLLAPAPDGPRELVLNYYGRIVALGAGQTSNWLLDAHPDLYRAAALAEAYAFLKDEARMAVWEARTQDRIEELNAQARRRNVGGAPVRLRAPRVV